MRRKYFTNLPVRLASHTHSRRLTYTEHTRSQECNNQSLKQTTQQITSVLNVVRYVRL